MAYVCYDCQIIFPSKRANCPFCGGRIYSDEKSDSVLQSEGFTISDIKTKPNNATNNATDDFRIDDSDILSSLRRSYDKEHRRADRTNDNTSSTATPNAITPPAPQGSTHTMTETSRASVEATPPPDDFFSQFQASTITTTNIPTVGGPSENRTILSPPVDEGLGRELQSIEQQQRRIRNNYRRLAILNFFSSINWRVIFRIIFAIAVMFGLWTVWKMRYVLLNSIYNFFIALIPLIIIIWIIVLIFRSFFK